MRPILNARDKAVFHRVYVAIFNMPRVVCFIANEMLPKASLPNAALAARQANGAQPLLFRQRLCKTRLDQAPARRKIGVVRRQRQHGMKMIRENDERVDLERIATACRCDRIAENTDT